MESERVKTHRILGVVSAPHAVRNLLDSFKRRVERGRVALFHEETRSALWFPGADVGRLQKRPHGALGGHRVISDKLAVPGNRATEIARPGPVRTRVDDDVTDVPCPQFLRLWRVTHKAIDFPFRKKAH